MKVVHVETQITMILGLMDDDGNIVEKIPATNTIAILSEAEYSKAYEQAIAFRERVKEDRCPADS